MNWPPISYIQANGRQFAAVFFVENEARRGFAPCLGSRVADLRRNLGRLEDWNRRAVPCSQLIARLLSDDSSKL